uniref:MAK10-like protein n=1 Tax=Tanacetum cinerariifolium TaxID=118510 RepID=A0A699GXQ5_TANCI|nr:MAK10-like protein [Tanacetum cinerariifolium]
MGDENPHRTLRDYSRPSHEGYRNTIEVPNENDLVPLRPDTIRLVQNGCSFHRLRSEDPNQLLKDFLKIVDSVDLNVENKEEKRLRTIDQVAGGKLHDKNKEESWALLEDLTLYDNKSWNDPRDFAKPVKAISMPHDVPSASDRHLIKLKNQFQLKKEMESRDTTPRECEGLTNEVDDEVGSNKLEEQEEADLEYFNTFPSMKELEYHEWLLKNPRPPWVRAKIRTKNLNNIKISYMIDHNLENQVYINFESPINVKSRRHYKKIISQNLKSRQKPSNLCKRSNFVGRVKGLKFFIGNFTYECDFMI